VPEGTASRALIVEDADAPASKPLVHAIVWDIPADECRIAEGIIVADDAGGKDGDVGRNSFLREGWLAPDPPTGHGEHDHVSRYRSGRHWTPAPAAARSQRRLRGGCLRPPC
jgi:phosphatidylethanolamine-binding protein (PEBP) family uncharacterized protein